MAAKRKSAGQDDSGLEQSFQAAIRAALAAPKSDEAWQHLEDLADEIQRHDDAGAAYREALRADMPKDVATHLAERAVQYHEEWLGDTPATMVSLLGQIVERDPDAEWAFERLTVMLTQNEQWDDLLSLYDATLAKTRSVDKRRRLLEDAAQVAKDFADKSDRAVGYLQQQLSLDPQNAGLVASLERVLERQERWNDLVALWRGRLPDLPPADARAVRTRIALLCLEQLADDKRALEELRQLLDESPGHLEACELLERVVGSERAGADTRAAALGLLRTNYELASKPDDLIRVLRMAMGFADGVEKRGLHRETGSRLAILRRDEEAIEQYAAVLSADSSDADARRQLRQLALRSKRHDLHAAALVHAADATSEPAQQAAVLLEAATIRGNQLEDTEGAIALYARVLGTVDADPSHSLSAAHNLNELYAQSGRDAERLAVLERLSTLERSSAVRRFVLGEAAQLAEKLGDVDRSLANWEPVLARAPNDFEALSAVVDLCDRSGRNAELVESLRRRAEASRLPAQRRADLVRVADVQEHRLADVAGAIDTWLLVRRDYGETAETLAALDRLFTTAERHVELGEMLDGAASGERGRIAGLLARLGDVQRVALGAPEQALRAYVRGLGVDPAQVEARAGLQALLEIDACRVGAAEALAQAFSETDDWAVVVTLSDARIGAGGAKAARVLREAAELWEKRGSDQERALAAIARALPYEPHDLALEGELVRLAEATGQWSMAATALGEAALRTEVASRAAELCRRQGGIHEHELVDPAGALAAYRAAAERAPDDVALHEAVARCAARSGDFALAAVAAATAIRLRDRVSSELVGWLEAAADAQQAWRALADAVVAAVAGAELRPALAQRLETRAATYFLERVGDGAAADAAAVRAVNLDPHDVETLRLLVTLQRSASSPALIDTLLALHGLDEGSLDSLHEAAERALERREPRVANILGRLFRRASEMWLRGEKAHGERQAETAAEWALDRTVDELIAAGQRLRAAEVLMDATRLPLPLERELELRRRAAEMWATEGDRGRAIDVYRSVLAKAPRDIDTLHRAAALCEGEGRLSDSLGLRLAELELTDDPERRLELRLENARLTGQLEARGGRVESLRANLVDAPGHQATLDALSEILTERGRHAELCTVLGEQAAMLEQRGPESPELARAAELHARVARIAEEKLGDLDQAVTSLQRVVEIEPRNEALDSLARLLLKRDEPAAAAKWLAQRLERSSGKERVPVLLRLARAHLAAEQRDAAVAALETAFAEAPRNAEVRKLLLTQHRQREDWKALGQTLSVAAENVADDAAVLAYAREAAEIYCDRLDTPELAVPMLKRAVALEPDDRKLKSMLAEGLTRRGELDEAAELLAALIEDFGRRRSPERAAVHLQLAKVCHAQGRGEEAIEQLDNASKMDSGNIEILAMLARLARESGQLDRAERAYRTLLVTLRRLGPDELRAAPVGTAATLFELCRIASARGQADKAEELVQSALESLTQNDAEGPRVQASLRDAGEHELLRRVLEARLEHVRGAHRRAEILGDLATLLEGPLGRPRDALERRFEAIDTDPGSPIHHEAVFALCKSLDELERYVSTVEELLTRSRRDTDVHVRCELLLRLGEVRESHGDLDGASGLFAQAEALGVRLVDVWRAAARVAAARGDAEENMRLLGKLASLGGAEVDTRTDALYRLAEVQLASADTLAEGIDSLSRALAEDSRTERAALILRRATEVNEPDARLLELYEQVARRSNDRELLLHFLERRAALPEVTPEQVREAVALATELEQRERAETLMLRAVTVAEPLEDGTQRVAWALLGLAEFRNEAGDVAAAVKWLCDAADVAEPAKLYALGRQVAERAAAPGADLTLAAKLYERLLERDATVRDAWEPLTDIYRRLGEVDKLKRVVDETLDGLQDPHDRNALRVMLARALLGREERGDDAVRVLQDVLGEDPQHDEAQGLLLEHLERTGNIEELNELMRRQYTAAIESGEPNAIRATTKRLAARVEEAEAVDVLRTALERTGDDVALLQALLGRLPADHDVYERAALRERLVGLQQGDEAGHGALELCRTYEELGDQAAALRALELGYQRAPGIVELRERLEAYYRASGDFAGMVRMLSDAAAQQADPVVKASLLREAASVQREQLGDAAGAARLLAQASELAPGDIALRVEVALTMHAGGDPEGALGTLSEALEEAADDDARLELLRARARLREPADEVGILHDLEQAFAIHAEVVVDDLVQTLDRRRGSAHEQGDTESERAATLRLADLMLWQGHRAEVSSLLGAWVQGAPEDAAAMHQLLALDQEDGRWDAVARVCEQLLPLESGDAQVAVVLTLGHAYRELATPELARTGLEAVRARQPANAEVRLALRDLYEQTGARREFALMLLEDAAGLEDRRAAGELSLRAGLSLVEYGDAAAAVPALRDAVALLPDVSDAVVALADAYILAGWYDDADAVLDEAIGAAKGRRTEAQCSFFHRKAHLAAARSDHAAQFGFLQEAHNCFKKNGQVAAELADLAEAMGDFDVAMKTLRTITLLDAPCPISQAEAFMRQGRIALRQGDKRSAVMWGRRARREAPDNPEIEAFLKEAESAGGK